MVSAKDKLLSKLPEVRKQQQRFEKVFGKDVASQVQREQALFDARNNFTSGGGSKQLGQQISSNQLSKIRAQNGRSKEAEDLSRKIETSKKLSDKRRLGILLSRALARERSIRDGISIDIARRRLQSESAKFVRDQAKEKRDPVTGNVIRKKIDISTNLRQGKFVKKLIAEQKRAVKEEDAKKEKVTGEEPKTKLEMKVEEPKTKLEMKVEELEEKRAVLREDISSRALTPNTIKDLVKQIATGKRPNIFGVNTILSQPGLIQKEAIKNIFTIEQRLIETFLGAKKIPSIVRQLKSNPKDIIPLSGALLSGIKLDLLNTAKIAKTSPTEAVVIIGTDVFIGKGIGDGFKIVGKVSGKAAKVIIDSSDDVRIFKNINKNPQQKLDFSVLGEIDKNINIENIRPRIKKASVNLKNLESSIKILDSVNKRINILEQKIPSKKVLDRLDPPALKLIKKKLNVLRKTKKEKLILRQKINRFNSIVNKDLGALSRIKNQILIDNLRRRVSGIRRSKFGKDIRKDVLTRIKDIQSIKKLSKKPLREVVIRTKGTKVPSARKIAAKRFAGKKVKGKEIKLRIDLDDKLIRNLKANINQVKVRLKSGADIVVLDPKTKRFKIVASKRKIKKSKVAFKLDTKAAVNKVKFKLNQLKNRLRSGADTIVFDSKKKIFKVVESKPRFKKKKVGKIKPTFRIDRNKFSINLRNQFNRLKSGADIRVFDPKTKKFKIVPFKRKFKKSKTKGLQFSIDKNFIGFNIKKLSNRLKSGADIVVFDPKIKGFKIVPSKLKFKKSKVTFVKTSQSGLKKLKGSKRIKKIRKIPKALPKTKPKSKIKFIKASSLALQRLRQLQKVRKIRKIPKPKKLKTIPTTKPTSPSQPVSFTFDRIPETKVPKGFKAVRTESGQILLQKTKTVLKQKVKPQQQPIVLIKANQIALQRFKQQQGLLQKQIQKVKQKTKLSQKQKQFLNQKQRKFQSLKTKTIQLTKQTQKLRSLQRFATAQLLKFAQAQSQAQDQAQAQPQAQKFKSTTDTLTKQKLLFGFRSKQKQPQRTKTPIVPKITTTKTPGKTLRPPKIKLKKLIRKKKGKGFVQVFNVFGKSRGKFVKLNVKPLKKIDALSRGAFAVDRTTAKTFKIISAGRSKKPGNLLKKERGYFNNNKLKLRSFRIKKGKKVKLINKHIEKRRFGIDTKGEKSGLTIAKFLKQRRRDVRKVKREITPTRRKELLKNLTRARMIKRKLSKGGKK